MVGINHLLPRKSISQPFA